MNKDYILQKMKPYLKNKSSITEFDFNNLFSKFDKKLIYKIINVLMELGIEIDYTNKEIAIRSEEKSNEIENEARNILELKNLTNEQLCVIYQKGNKSALDSLVSKNTGLVYSRVSRNMKKYRHKLDEDDLSQYGYMGLIEAAGRFDQGKEAKFSTYAIYWIDQSIMRNIMDYGFTVRVPVHQFERVSYIVGIMIKNPNATKEELLEIIKEKGISKSQFEQILVIKENILSTASLNSIVGAEMEGEELGDFIPDEDFSVEDQVEYENLKEIVEFVLSSLTEKEQEILKLRFGIKDGAPKTLEEIGLEYNVTRERIRQIEAKALRKLRHPSRIKYLKDFIY